MSAPKRKALGRGLAALIPGAPAPGAPALVGRRPVEGTRDGIRTIPPRETGGNMDIRGLVAGSTLMLSAQVEGALFSVGDTHAAQGDGEVCGTAIESPCSLAARFDLIKGANLSFPRFTTPGPVGRHLDQKGYEATTGIGPDLFEAARQAVMGMIDLLTKRHKMSAVEAYMLCSACADLRISEIVDMPNWVVSLYFPRVVFE